MSRDNYPPDIHCYDSDPRSPYFVDPDAWAEDVAAEVADEWEREFNNTGIISYNGYEKPDLEELMRQGKRDNISDTIYWLAYDTCLAQPQDYRPEPMIQED